MSADPIVRAVSLIFGDLRTAEELAEQIIEGARHVGKFAALRPETQDERLRNARFVREVAERTARLAARMERAIESGVPE